jgi:hypothetical protein
MVSIERRSAPLCDKCGHAHRRVLSTGSGRWCSSTAKDSRRKRWRCRLSFRAGASSAIPPAPLSLQRGASGAVTSCAAGIVGRASVTGLSARTSSGRSIAAPVRQIDAGRLAPTAGSDTRAARDPRMGDSSNGAAPRPEPCLLCPRCQSPKTTVRLKTLYGRYWRCATCGHVWHAEQQSPAE